MTLKYIWSQSSVNISIPPCPLPVNQRFFNDLSKGNCLSQSKSQVLFYWFQAKASQPTHNTHNQQHHPTPPTHSFSAGMPVRSSAFTIQSKGGPNGN